MNTILAKVRLGGKIALASASSGIAATLLKGGRTAHTTFGIPITLAHVETPVSSVKKNSSHAELLRRTSLIVIDECSALHRRGYEVVDRMLQDFKDTESLFGNIPVLLAGDFRQTLPVVQRGSAPDQLAACLKNSYLWRHVQIMRLRTNMRAHTTGDVGSSRFAAHLLRIGNGNVPSDHLDNIKIPQGVGTCVQSLDDLKKAVYPDLNTNIQNHEWLASRAILAPKNCTVRELNKSLLDEMSTRARVYYSVDSILDGKEDEGFLYPPGFLNKIEMSGLPSHEITLKVGVPVMLLRNMSKLFLLRYI